MAENNNSQTAPELRKLICSAVSGMKYGQVVFVIKNGKIVQVERTEKSRLTDLEGQFGDGI